MQFTIKTLDELDIVSNQNLSVEMLLVRLMYLSSIKSKNLEEKKRFIEKTEKNIMPDLVSDTINQLKMCHKKKINLKHNQK